MRTERDRNARANPLPKGDEFFTEISGVDDRLRDLRERARTGVDMLSAASSIAALQVDLIASSLRLLRLVDEIAFQLLEEQCPLQERIRRLRCLTRMTGRIQGTIFRAIDIYIWCFGGKEAIAIQTTAEWIRRQRARAPAEESGLEIDQILKIMIEKSAK
jgi:hypothetical protein